MRYLYTRWLPAITPTIVLRSITYQVDPNLEAEMAIPHEALELVIK